MQGYNFARNVTKNGINMADQEDFKASVKEVFKRFNGLIIDPGSEIN